MADPSKYDITVAAHATYVADQSDPSRNQYVFAYRITVTNTGSVAAQLVSRHWIITDGEHRVQEVKGLGVVGQQPLLKPGESFEYTSGTHLPTPVGTMRGTYQMVAEDGHAFDASIPPFTLSVPRVLALALYRTFRSSSRGGFRFLRSHRPPDDADREHERQQRFQEEPDHDCDAPSPAAPCAARVRRRRARRAGRGLHHGAVRTTFRAAIRAGSGRRRDSAFAAAHISPGIRGANCPAGRRTACRRPGPPFASAAPRSRDPRRRRAPPGARLATRPTGVDARDAAAVRAFFEGHFSPYGVVADDGRIEGTITGYYEPLLAGSRTKNERFTVPLYSAPDDLLTIDLAALYPELKDKRLRGRVDGRKVVPYWARSDIETGKAPVGDKVLVYVEDPVEAFFLQIQGSGRVALADGSVMRVGYADQNGHPYRSIGRVLIERGELSPDRASMQGIREWGRRHPDQLPALLDENPSYVFFREVPPPVPGTLEAAIDGPIGTLGVPLAAGRTLAVDARFIPLGAPVFLATTHPLATAPLDRLMLAQDTGGAIRGAIRADFFWGFGDDAGREAGRMKQDGRMWVLWPKDAGPPKP